MRPTTPRLDIECLEDRTTPATLSFSGNTVTYTAAAGETNNIKLTTTGTGFTIADAVRITLSGAPGFTLATTGKTATFTGAVPANLVVNITAGDRNDVITGAAFTSGRLVVAGGAGTDTITGGSRDDTLSGGDANDTLNGGLGNDTITDGIGSNKLNGNGGNDTITGGTGIDTIDGGDGNDTIRAGAGNDKVNGQAGDDTIRGELGDDVLTGAAGNDTILGGDGKDALNGNDGFDALLGGGGQDTLLGGNDNDFLDGGLGNDTLKGEGASDFLLGRDGNDVLDGGTGALTDLNLIDPGTGTNAILNPLFAVDLEQLKGLLASVGTVSRAQVEQYTVYLTNVFDNQFDAELASILNRYFGPAQPPLSGPAAAEALFASIDAAALRLAATP